MNAAAPAAELSLKAALGPWERRLTFESLGRWLVRGAIVALAIVTVVLLVGWVAPIPEESLRPWALEIGLLPLLGACIIGLWPRSHLQSAAVVDGRLNLGDRLATAWAFRASGTPILELQRDDALARLGRRRPAAEISWRPDRKETIALGAALLVGVLVLMTPSPQQTVLDQQAAQELAVQQASQQLDALRQQADTSTNLTPDQVKQLDELLQQAQGQLAQTHTAQDANTVLAKTQDQVSQQLGDPNADLRDQALAAMSETLAAEPQTRALAAALQQEDAQASSTAIQNLAAQSDQLSDVERQSLSRALQRAANVGKADQRTSSALRDASQALNAGTSPKSALSQADAALRDSIQASQGQADVNATVQQLHDLQTQLASGQPMNMPSDQTSGQAVMPADAGAAAPSGTPVAIDGGSSSQTVADPSSGSGARGAGVGAGANTSPDQSLSNGQAAENVFVAGRASDASGDQPDLVNQPFTVRGAPRPYRDVLNQYAQSSRDYVDRPDISPAVRDLVKQYFQQLESDQ